MWFTDLKAVSRNKPLIKYRFYLDVKNRVSANKFEVKIKELGGVSVFMIFYYVNRYLIYVIFPNM